MIRFDSEAPELDDRVRGLVLTYRRPRHATATVRHLIEAEGFRPEQLLLVVNGEGGLTDPSLSARVPSLVLRENLGPAGGFREGLKRLADTTNVEWIYVCEDDVDGLSLPSPRVADLLSLVSPGVVGEGSKLGAVVAYGRLLDWKTGLTRPHLPDRSGRRLQVTDVAAWGSTLVSAEPIRTGILPDAKWFFGFEDFDFFLSLRKAGFAVVLDRDSALAVEDEELHTSDLAATSLSLRRYYTTRNFFELRRRHGHATWTATHVVKSIRRAQLALDYQERRAIFDGLLDGFRGRLGRRGEET